MNVGSLFTGIGGFDLGLERAGMRVVWQCEQDEFCRRVLARHWPDVPCYPDVRALVADTDRGLAEPGQVARPALREEAASAGDGDVGGATGLGGGWSGVPVPVPPVDVLCGGFPCQDISLAGKGAGIDGERSGLWGEYARLVGELRPRYVIVENVAALLARGLDRVLADLVALGYDAEWDCLPASAFGAPHRRDRLWLVAYPSGPTGGMAEPRSGGQGREPAGSCEPALVRQDDGPRGSEGLAPRDRARDVADPELTRLEGHRPGALRARATTGSGTGGGELQDADERALLPWRVGGRAAQTGGAEWWATEPPVGRVAHGVPDRLDQLAALGNALVPQIAEWLGRRILEAENMTGEQRAA